MKSWTRNDFLTALAIVIPILIAALVWFAGIPVLQGRMEERLNSLKDVVNSTHAETVETLKEHGAKLDNFGQRISHVEGALEHGVVRSGTNQ